MKTAGANGRENMAEDVNETLAKKMALR